LRSDPNLLVGLERGDDAGVYKLSGDLAIIQTVDFFTPIVDDPYTFGQIAAANALSDVYAMGGKPLTAMNVVCFPAKTMDIGILNSILKGGLDKLREAETTLVGGHSIDDNELKYGLSVTGIIHPDKVLTNGEAKIDDALILTKPLGTGIINTAIKGGLASEEAIEKVTKSMTRLNKNASVAMQEIGVNACTDVTGFSLLGHAVEMVQGNDFGMAINSAAVPCFPEAQEYAQMGLVPGGTYRNKDFYSRYVELAPELAPYLIDILFDPQTSGGLLISVPRDKADSLIDKIRRGSQEQAAIIGEITAEPKGKIVVR
jgi:selenide,water dikinase